VNETRIEVWAAWWDEFRRRLNRLQDFHYVAVPERQERGAWHIHVAVNGRQNWKLLRSIWLSVISKAGTDGAVNDSIRSFKKYCVFKRIGGKGRAMRHLIATYIAKCVGKDAAGAGFNKKRYWTSKGIPIPEVQSYDCSASGLRRFAVNAQHTSRVESWYLWCGVALVWFFGFVVFQTEGGRVIHRISTFFRFPCCAMPLRILVAPNLGGQRNG
jgi:hypothetical protein